MANTSEGAVATVAQAAVTSGEQAAVSSVAKAAGQAEATTVVSQASKTTVAEVTQTAATQGEKAAATQAAQAVGKPATAVISEAEFAATLAEVEAQVATEAQVAAEAAAARNQAATQATKAPPTQPAPATQPATPPVTQPATNVPQQPVSTAGNSVIANQAIGKGIPKGPFLEVEVATTGSILKVETAAMKTVTNDRYWHILLGEKDSHWIKHNFARIATDHTEAAPKILEVLLNAVRDGKLPQAGAFKISGFVGQEEVFIRGSVVDGVVKWGTAYIP